MECAFRGVGITGSVERLEQVRAVVRVTLDAIGYDALVAERDRLLVAAEFVLDKKAAVKRGEGRKADLIGYYFHEPDPIRGLQTAVDFVRIHPQEDADRG